jgi:hypothetical protein
MAIIPTALQTLFTNAEFQSFHNSCDPHFYDSVTRFLTATMDEVRLSTSTRVALDILATIGLSDAGRFREAVLRRELYGTIAYDRQRDHSSHTLYNYLLGWYFLINSPRLRAAFTEELTKRGIPHVSLQPFKDSYTFFGCVWQYASLLHDIGYMFEGSRSRMSFEESSKQASIGAQVAKDYFNHTFWVESEVDITPFKRQLFARLGEHLCPPAFDNTNTLWEIADELRDLGNLIELQTAVVETVNSATAIKDRVPLLGNHHVDAFELWAHHYERFGNPTMGDRIRSVSKIFGKLIDTGLPGPNICLLDHGVCGGLLQLSAATYYYRLYAAASKVGAVKPPEVAMFLKDRGWSPAFWWTGIVWGTAAVAVHNVQQMGATAEKLDSGWPGKLELSHDPLCYLGVLVDIIQEWDRYSVFKSIDREPIQGIEVELEKNAGKIVVRFKEPDAQKRAGKVIEELDKALTGWNDIVDVEPKPPRA